MMASETVLVAAKVMREKSIGSVVVMEDSDVVGIFTERDVVQRVVSAHHDPAAVPLRDVMTTPVATCRPETSLEDCAAIMAEHGIRHLPVAQGPRIAGIITSRDILAYQVGDQKSTIKDLVDHIFNHH